jgi:CHAT domain-containing protein
LCLVCLALSTSAAPPVNRPLLQSQTTELKVGEPISQEITGGKSAAFSVSIPARQYFRVSVDQQGVVLTVELFDLDGKSIVRLESVSGAYGPIYVSHVSTSAEQYKLEVRSTESWARGGRFQVALDTVRDVEPSDTIRIGAQQAFAEGQALIARALEQPGDEAKKSRDAALEKFKTARDQWHGLNDAHGEATSLYTIGSAYQRYFGKSSDAKEFLSQALTLVPQLPANDWRLVASIWNDLGVTHDSLYDEKNARAALEKALEMFDANQDLRGRASANNNLGLVYARLGQAREAIKAFQIALPIRHADNDKANELNTLNNLGGAYETLGEPGQALEYYTQALQGWKETKDSRIAIGLNNVARASDTLGLWQTALGYYQEALKLVQQQGQRRIEATFRYNIGDLYSRLNKPELALDSYKAALLIQQENKNPRDEANVLAHIAQIYFDSRQPDQAIENYDKAIHILESNKDAIELRRVYAYTLIGIATVYLNRDPAKALEYSEKAKELSQLAGDVQQEATALEKMGQAYEALGRHSQALESFNSALVSRRDLGDKVGQASTLFEIAHLKSNLGEYREAATLSEDVLKIVESLRGNLVSRQLRTSYFEKTQRYYELSIDIKMRLFEKQHTAEDRAAALATSEQKRARGLIDLLTEANADIRRGVDPTLLAQSRENEEKLRTKSRLKELLINEIRVNEKLLERSNTPPVLRRIDELKQKLTAVTKDLTDLSNEYDEIQTRIRSRSPSFAALNTPSTLSTKELQSLLSADTAMVQYSLGENRSYVWVVTSNDIQSSALPGRDSIEGLVQKTLNALTARSQRVENETAAQRDARIRDADTTYAQASAELGEMVIGPIRPLVNKKQLVIVADGALQLLSFAALPLSTKSTLAGETKQVLQPATMLTEHEIINVSSASVMALQRKEIANRKLAPLSLAIVADPVFDAKDERFVELSRRRGAKPTSSTISAVSAEPSASESKTDNAMLEGALRDVGLDPNALGRLPKSRWEAIDISNLVPPSQSFVALDFQANRDTVTSGKLANYRYVHFATHGVLDLEHPELSGIVLSRFDEKGRPQDGYLRLYDIYNLNLPAELVVLSACQTGAGKQIRGEGLIALTRGFMYAGAASVVASLWKVDDVATAELMKRFYQEMFINKKKPSAALRDAQLSLAKTTRWKSPYYWAGFVLQGEWR